MIDYWYLFIYLIIGYFNNNGLKSYAVVVQKVFS